MPSQLNELPRRVQHWVQSASSFWERHDDAPTPKPTQALSSLMWGEEVEYEYWRESSQAAYSENSGTFVTSRTEFSAGTDLGGRSHFLRRQSIIAQSVDTRTFATARERVSTSPDLFIDDAGNGPEWETGRSSRPRINLDIGTIKEEIDNNEGFPPSDLNWGFRLSPALLENDDENGSEQGFSQVSQLAEIKSEEQSSDEEMDSDGESVSSSSSHISLAAADRLSSIRSSVFWTQAEFAIELCDRDRQLLRYLFTAWPTPQTIFSILYGEYSELTIQDVFLPKLQNNVTMVHYCLALAAQLYKKRSGKQGLEKEQVDNFISAKFHNILSSLPSDMANQEANDEIVHQTLEAALGITLFHRSIKHNDPLCTRIYPWQKYFNAALQLVLKMGSHSLLRSEAHPVLAVVAWIDILGSTIRGRKPYFNELYRDKYYSTASHSMGIYRLTNCEDRVFYLISEIAVLEQLQNNAMSHLPYLNQAIDLLEYQLGCLDVAMSRIPMEGDVHSLWGSYMVTNAFKVAARIYLNRTATRSLTRHSQCIALVEELTGILRSLESEYRHLDHHLIWVYLIGGTASLSNSGFRIFFEQKASQFHNTGASGIFSNLEAVLRETWAYLDTIVEQNGGPESLTIAYVTWRWQELRTMIWARDWECLLI